MKILWGLLFIFFFVANVLAGIFTYLMEVIMRHTYMDTASRFHRLIFIVIVAVLLTIGYSMAHAEDEGKILAQNACVYKTIKCECLLIEIDSKHYIVARRGEELIVVYEIVGKGDDMKLVLIWENGVKI